MSNEATIDTPTFQLADLLLEGTLVRQLRDWAAAGMSAEAIAKELYLVSNRKVDISHQTIATWLKTLDC